MTKNKGAIGGHNNTTRIKELLEMGFIDPQKKLDGGVLRMRRHLLARTVLVALLLCGAGVSSNAVTQVGPGYSIEIEPHDSYARWYRT